MKGFLRIAGACMVTALSLVGCANNGVSDSSQATTERPMVLTLAHNLSETHITSKALDRFAQTLQEKSSGRLKVRIYPSGQLGSETEVLEQIMAGVGDLTRVGAPGLAAYDDAYHTFGLPFLFADQEEYYRVMDSPQMAEFFQSTKDLGFVTLTYYTSGARSFYTVNKPIREPGDLKGLKIRVQNMRSQTDMMKALGGTAVVIPFGDIFTSLQTGVIDGAESNETALTMASHGEVCKVFSLDEHAMIPDVLSISSKTWDRLTGEDQKLLLEAARESTQWHKEAWEKATEEAIAEAKEKMNVEFVEDVDKEAFRKATESMVDSYGKEYPRVAELLDVIERAKKG